MGFEARELVSLLNETWEDLQSRSAVRNDPRPYSGQAGIADAEPQGHRSSGQPSSSSSQGTDLLFQCPSERDTLLVEVAPGNATSTEDSSALRCSRRHVHGAVRVLSSVSCPCSASHQDVKFRHAKRGKDRKTPRDGLTERSPSPQAQGDV